MSGRTYANNVNGRGNGASAGRGSGTNSANYGATNAVPGTSSLQANANAYYYQQTSHSYPVQYYPTNPQMVGMWQQSPPTGSTHGAATGTSSGTAPANASAAVPAGTTYAHAIPITTSNQPQYVQGYRHAMPQHVQWSLPPGTQYMSPAQMGMISSAAPPNSSFPTPSTTTTSNPQPRQRKIPTITDKSGKPIDFTVSKPAQPTPSSDSVSSNGVTQPASSSTEVSPPTNPSTSIVSSHDAGLKLREAAERAIIESGGTIPMKRKDEHERLRKDDQEEVVHAQKQPEDVVVAAVQESEDPNVRLAVEERARKQVEDEEHHKQLAMKQLEEEEKARQEAEEKARQEAEERARQEEEERVRQEAEEQARQEAEERARQEAEEQAKLKRDATAPLSSLAARLQMRKGDDDNSQQLPSQVPTDTALSRSESLGAHRPGGNVRPPRSVTSVDAPVEISNSRTWRKVYNKGELLRFRDLKICCVRPTDLPEMHVNVAAPSNRRGSSQSWARDSNKPFPSPQENARGDHNNRRQSSTGSMNSMNNVTTPEQWSRGMAIQQKNTPAGRGGRGGRGDRGGSFAPNQQDFDDPLPALKRSENRWVPVKDTSAFVVTEKTVKSILNKMTKEKFDKLSDQMCEIKIVSHEMLTMMINHIYEKAICEPSFSEMYAELCVKLSLTAKKSIFVRIIESDEEPPTDDGLSELHGNQGGSSGNPVYRWSNDVNTDDSEIMGPFESPEECVNCAVDAENSPDPFPRKEIELELHALKIHRGMFIKIMHAKNDPSTFYTVFFPMNKVVEVGQQLSKDLFLSELECLKDGNKKNNFKRILLYKCEDEFNKKGIYENWKIEKKKHEDNKSSLSDSERLEKESELEFRRMKLKKQMLGNIKFIGELYKKDMLKEKIMHYCIQQLLKIEENSNGDLSLIKDDEMDEEDHEALCNLFASIGRQIDNVLSRSQMHFYFKRIAALSTEKTLSSRSRFMYKDLLELKENKWKARREEETAKTLDEIKKDFEKEERLAAQQSQQSQMQSRPVPANLARNTSSGSRGSVRGGINKGVPNYGEVKDDSRRDHSDPHFRQKPVKDSRDIRSFNRTEDVPPPQILTRSASGNVPPKSSGPSVKPAPSIAEEKKKSIPPEEIIQRKAQSMRTEFIQSRGQVSEDDLIFSFTDITTLPDFGRIFVQKNADFAIDCKAYELDAVISILSLLVSKGRLTPSDFDLPFGELVEFLPDFITDSPSAVQAIGEMIAAFINIKTLSFLWLCELCEKLQNELCAEHFPSLISRIIECLKPKYGDKASLRADLGPYENRLSHLVGESQWNHVIYDEK